MSRSTLANSLDQQVNSLIAFLSIANHQIVLDQVRELCRRLPTNHKVAARQLKLSLKSLGVEIKHTHALKAVTQMRGASGFLGSDDAIRWDVASWFDDAPAISARRELFTDLGKACDQVCARIREQFERGDEPLIRFRIDSRAVEIQTVGEPNKGWRAVIVATDSLAAPCEFGIEQQIRLGERLRRLIEGDLGGWLDGIACLDPETNRRGGLAISIDGKVGDICHESQMLCMLADLLDTETNWSAAQPSFDRYGQRLDLLTQMDNFNWVPVADSVWQGLYSRQNSFEQRHEEPFAQWIADRVTTSAVERFAPETLNLTIVEKARLLMQLSDSDIAEKLRVPLDQWLSYKSAGELPVTLFRPLREAIGLGSENDLLGEAEGTVRMPLPRHEDIGIFLSRFDTVEVPESEGTQQLAQRLRRLCATPFAERRRWDKHPISELKAINQEARFEGLVICAMMEKQFVSDLPLGYSRYGLVLVLTFANEIDVHTQDGQLEVGNSAMDLPAEDDEEPVTAAWLARFNDPKLTGEELLRYSEKVDQMRNPDGDDESKFDTTIFAAAKVFRSEPQKAHSANVRMQAVSRLLQRDSLAPWVLRGAEVGASMLSRPVFEAAARCPLVDIQGRPGFDLQAFKRVLVEHVRSWEH
jgi:hypothetical protein